MAVTVSPRLRLSANGARALLEVPGRAARVVDLASGRARWELGEDGLDAPPVLSASGGAVAWASGEEEATVVSDAGTARVRLPAPRGLLRGLAPGDAGDRLACLVGGETSRLLVVRGGEGGVEVGVDVPVYGTGFVLANGDCSLLVSGSSEQFGEQRFTGAFAHDGGELRPLWTEETEAGAYGALAVYGDWVVAAGAAGIAGWRRDGERFSLDGSMRERVVFSSDGRHLLVSRVEEVIAVTSARTLFRLIDLSSGERVRSTVHLVADRQGALFALTPDLDLIEVRAARDGELRVTALGWSGTA